MFAVLVSFLYKKSQAAQQLPYAYGPVGWFSTIHTERDSTRAAERAHIHPSAPPLNSPLPGPRPRPRRPVSPLSRSVLNLSPLPLSNAHTPQHTKHYYEILVFSPRAFPYVLSAASASSSSVTRALRSASIPSTSSDGTDGGSSGDTFRVRGGPNEKA